MFIDELNASEEILKQEKALEKARKKLEAIRVARYRRDIADEEAEEMIKQNEAWIYKNEQYKRDKRFYFLLQTQEMSKFNYYILGWTL